MLGRTIRALLGGGLAIALLACSRGASATAPVAAGRGAPSTQPGRTMSQADGNLLQIIASHSTPILIVRIEKIAGEERLDGERTGGTFQAKVLRELTSGLWHGPSELVVGFARHASPMLRVRTGMLGFDAVDLAPGKLLLLALPDVPGTDQPLPAAGLAARAVAPLQSADDATVRAVEGALAIEAAREEPARADLISRALESGLPLLVQYGHYAAGELQRIPRPVAVGLETRLLEDEKRPAKDRAMALSTLELSLWNDQVVDDPENRRIVEAFIATLTTRDLDLRRQLVETLSTLLESDAQPGSKAARSAATLMKGVAVRKGPALDAALKAIAADPETAGDARWLSRTVASAGRG